MKKFLPLSKQNESKGFTLIELLVVIAIIAILAVIGISVYSGAQGNARDARRRAEITQIAHSIETSKDFTTGLYKWDTTVSGNDFPKGVPTDPSSPVLYCIATDTVVTIPPTAPTTNWTTATCGTFTVGTGGTMVTADLATSIAAGAPAAGKIGNGSIKAWTLCAAMERSATPFCVTSLTK